MDRVKVVKYTLSFKDLSTIINSYFEEKSNSESGLHESFSLNVYDSEDCLFAGKFIEYDNLYATVELEYQTINNIKL